MTVKRFADELGYRMETTKENPREVENKMREDEVNFEERKKQKESPTSKRK